MWASLDALASATSSIPWPQLVAGSIITALVGVVAFGVRALIKGDLVPRSVLQDSEARADKWESAWDASQETIKDFGGRIDAVTEGLRTIEKAMTSITSPLPRERA